MLVAIPFGNGYFVNENGEVFSYKNDGLKKLKPITNGHKGYAKVRLYAGCRDEWKDFFVHRLVAEAFIPNPDGFPIVNHKDENPLNNTVENLEWCTVKYNNRYGNALAKKSDTMKKRFEENPLERERMRMQSRVRVWTEDSRRKVSKSLSIPVVAIKNGDVVAWFESAKAAEEVTGVKRANICKVLKGERRYAGGYEWGYAACGGELEVNNR